MFLHLTTYLQGGAGRIVTDLATHQRRAGHRVVVVTSSEPKGDCRNYPFFLDELSAQGVEVLEVESLFDRQSASFVQALHAVRGALPLAQIRIVHAHAAFPALLGLSLRGVGATGCRVLQTVHGWGIRKTAEQSLQDVRVLNFLDGVVAVSEALRAQVIGLGVEPPLTCVIRNGVGPYEGGRIAPQHRARLEHWRRDQQRILCCIGTIGVRKNQQILVDALALLPPAVRPKVVFVGDGAVEDLRAHAESAGVTESVFCTGEVPNAADYLGWVDWCVLPSRDEGLPLSVVEAFRAGVPMVASDIPALREVIEDGRNGFLFASGDVAACASTLSRAVTAQQERVLEMKQHARAAWESAFQQETMNRRYDELYQRVSTQLVR